MEEELSTIHLRLTQVMIEHLDWSQCIQKYDRAATLFYLDPPYYEKPCYKYNFTHEDFVSLSSTLTNIKGKFFLSLNDCDPVREIFSQFNMYPVSLRYTVKKDNQIDAKELFITNYDLKMSA